MVGEDDASLRVYRPAQSFHPLLQEEQHGVVVVFTVAIGAAVKQVADGVNGNDIWWLVGEMVLDGCDRLLQTGLIQFHADLRRNNQIAL